MIDSDKIYSEAELVYNRKAADRNNYKNKRRTAITTTEGVRLKNPKKKKPRNQMEKVHILQSLRDYEDWDCEEEILF